MEEEIKILKNLIEYLQFKIDSGEHKIIYNDLMYDEKTIDCINSIENLIKAYKELKEIEQIHRQENGELREQVKELEEENEELKSCKFTMDFYELGKKNQRARIELDYIPVSLVQEKIEELKERLKHYGEYDKLNLLEKINVDLIDARIEVLQELLEKRK